MNMSGRLEGKVALITGAGSGMGYTMAKLFAEHGAKVAAIARRDEGLKKWSNVPNVLPIRADIRKLDDINRMVDDTERQFGKLDIVCNVAGIHDQLYPLTDTSDELWDNIMNTDLKAPFQICRKAITGMVERGHGVFLNVSSLVAFRGLHGPSYCAAKAGLIGMTLSIAVRYSSAGIRCNAINPGPIKTEINSTSGGEVHPDGIRLITEVAGRSLTRWLGQPEDVAATALFLCSDEAKHVNGAIVAVDGGMSAC
jgi:NAD(P)-dependent dehydrogenase (short-subunit alcohol dehydrogenase family)